METLKEFALFIEWGMAAIGGLIVFYINHRFFVKNQTDKNIMFEKEILDIKKDIAKTEKKFNDDYERVQKDMVLRDTRMTEFMTSMTEFKTDMKMAIQDIKSKLNHGIDSFNVTNRGISELLKSQEEDIKNLEKEQKEMFKELREEIKSKQDKQ